MNEIIKKKTIRLDGEEIQNPWEAIVRISSAIGQKLTCSKCGGREWKIALSALQGELDNLKQVNICYSCCTLEQLENILGKEQVEKMRKEWEVKLQRLEINPLSVAKYFYKKWEISDPAIMQRLIYFAHLEILKEKDIVLFEEKFQAWPGGPVLESVIYSMYENYENLKGFFAKIEEIEKEKTIICQYLDKVAKRYSNDFQIYREARNKLWEEFRQDLTDEGESKPIEEDKIFTFFLYQHQNQELTTLPS